MSMRETVRKQFNITQFEYGKHTETATLSLTYAIA